MKWGRDRKKNRNFHAHTGGHNVTPALAEYGIAKKFIGEGKDAKREEVSERVVEGGYNSPRELTALDVIKCALGLAFFVAVCYYGGVQYGR